MKKIIPILIAMTLTTCAFGQPTPTPQPEDPKEIRHKMDALSNTIERLTQRPFTSEESVSKPLVELIDESDKIEITLQGKKAREKSIQDKIAQLTQDARDKLENDSTLAELQKIVAIKRQTVASAQANYKMAVISAADLNAAMADAAEAEVKVEERREAVMAGAGGGDLDALNRELIDVSLDVSEQEAMLQTVQQKIVPLHQARSVVREYDRLNAELMRVGP